MFLALLSTAVMCLILGCGIPTVGSYVLTAAIAAPIAIGNGLDPYTVHFFILYYACLSAITPPVAAAALAASAIAGSRYFRTAWEATLLSVMLYLLPFLFVYGAGAARPRHARRLAERRAARRGDPGLHSGGGCDARASSFGALAWWERLCIAGVAFAAMVHICVTGSG